MYERFTDRARKIMQFATQEAQRFNHEYRGTEHILLGLVKEGSGVAATVLRNLGVDLRQIRFEIETLVQTGPGIVMMGKLPQTPAAKRAIECAMEESRNLNHNYVGSEHILLGLLREDKGVAATVLMNLGLRLEKVRAEVRATLHQPQDESGLENSSQAECRIRELDDETNPSIHPRTDGQVDIGLWVLRVCAWDGLLPACVLFVPILVHVLLPNNRGLIDFVGLTFPVGAFFIRLFVGTRHIWSNGCSNAFREVQACLLYLGVFVFVLVDTMLILSHEVQGVFANRDDNITMVVCVSIYLVCLVSQCTPDEASRATVP